MWTKAPFEKCLGVLCKTRTDRCWPLDPRSNGSESCITVAFKGVVDEHHKGGVQQIHSPLGARGRGAVWLSGGEAHVEGRGVVGPSGVMGIACGSGGNMMVAVVQRPWTNCHVV